MTTSAVLTSSTEPSTVAEVKTTLTSDACVDHPDCDVLLNDFDACNDTYVAMIVCRKSCAVCDVTTNAPSCFDVHQDCKILSEHLNVCENENFARTRCAQTCGVCGNMILTEKKLSRQILLFYVHFVKFFTYSKLIKLWILYLLYFLNMLSVLGIEKGLGTHSVKITVMLSILMYKGY